MHVQYTVRTHEVQTLQKSEHAVNHYTFKLLLEHISANTAVCETKLPKQAIKVNIVQKKKISIFITKIHSKGCTE